MTLAHVLSTKQERVPRVHWLCFSVVVTFACDFDIRAQHVFENICSRHNCAAYLPTYRRVYLFWLVQFCPFWISIRVYPTARLLHFSPLLLPLLPLFFVLALRLLLFPALLLFFCVSYCSCWSSSFGASLACASCFGCCSPRDLC